MRGVATVCCCLILGLAPATSFAEEQGGRFGPEAQFGLSAYRGLVEEHLAGVLRALRIVALASGARGAEYKPLLNRLAEDLPTDATAWFAFPDGSYYATAVGGMSEENLKDRGYFPALMGGKEIAGELVISKSTGHRSIVLATPVMSEGKVVGGIGVSLRVRLLSELVDQHLPLPPNGYFYALDRDTRIVLHRKAERLFKTPRDVGDEALGEEFKRTIRSSSGTFDYTLNGTPITSIFERSPALDWYFFIAQEEGATAGSDRRLHPVK